MSNRMDRDFDRVHADMDGLRADLRAEMKAQGVELRNEMSDRFGAVDARFDRLEAYISAVVGLIATQL